MSKKPTISERALIAQVPPKELVIGGRTFRATQVTLPTLSQTRDGQAVYFRVLEPYYRATELKRKEGDTTAAMEPPYLVKVEDLEDANRVKLYAINAVLKSKWDDDPEYNDDKYVGMAFAIMKLPKREGKRHRDLEILRLDMEDAEAA